jgi:hypothetical protein
MVGQHRSLVGVQLDLNGLGNRIRGLFEVFGNLVLILVVAVVAEEGELWGMG